MNSEHPGVAWLREQIDWSLEYARKNAAHRPIMPMRSHEMRDMIADCEAKLAILEEHPAIEEWNEPTTSVVTRCARCQNWLIAMFAPWPCTTLRVMASAYRHRDGYAEHWEHA